MMQEGDGVTRVLEPLHGHPWPEGSSSVCGGCAVTMGKCCCSLAADKAAVLELLDFSRML